MRRLLSLLLSLLVFLPTLPVIVPRPLAAQACEDSAEVVEQSVDPGDVVAPDTEVTVTWTLRNSGNCEWSRSYRLLFVDGERMEGPRTVRLRSPVEPGATVTLAVDAVAPADQGIYRGVWQLRNADGDLFGPELVAQLEVDAQTASTTDVVLPEVLVFGGMGGGGNMYSLRYCADQGELPDSPAVVVDYEALESRYTTIYLCSFAEGAEIGVEIVDPVGNRFSRTYTEDGPEIEVLEDGTEYFGTVQEIGLRWPDPALSGDWTLTVRSDNFEAETRLNIAPRQLPTVDEDAETLPQLENWPNAPIDPFMANEICYTYQLSQEMVVSGTAWPANTTLLIGVYQDRMGGSYLVDQYVAQTDDTGAFRVTSTAVAEAGRFTFFVEDQLDPARYSADGIQYNAISDGYTPFSCYLVEPTEGGDVPLRLAVTSGEWGYTRLEVLDFATGNSDYPTFTDGECDTSEPAWWPDGEWVLYQSNCVEVTQPQGGIELTAADNYDLYAIQIDLAGMIPAEEKLVRLTATPDLHETEPDVNLNGLIVYRATPVGDSLDQVGELRLLDIFEETDTSLAVLGRTPTWSPDGTRIAFMSDADGSWQIYLYDLEEETVTLVSEGCATHCRWPAWSPNGRQIIYQMATSLTDDTPAGLWMASVSGLSKPRLYLAGEYSRPSWSGAGWIAFEGPQGIYRANSSEPKPQLYLYSDEWTTYGSPVWSR